MPGLVSHVDVQKSVHDRPVRGAVRENPGSIAMARLRKMLMAVFTGDGLPARTIRMSIKLQGEQRLLA